MVFDFQHQSNELGVPLSGTCESARRDAECSGFGIDITSTRQVRFSARRRSGEHPISRLLLEYSESDRPEPPLFAAATGSVVPTTTPLPDEWPPLPGRRERFGAEVLPGEPALRLERGTQLVAPADLDSPCSGGFEAVLRVMGDAREAVANYAQQFADAGFTPLAADEPVVQDRSHDGAQVLIADFFAEGGGNLTAEAVVERGQRTYLLIARCGD